MSGEAFVQLGTAVIALLGAIITYILVPYVRSKTTTQQQESIAFWVSVAVNAAEQVFTGRGKGEQKKQYVLQFLSGKGITVSAAQLDALIEAAVFELNSLKS